MMLRITLWALLIGSIIMGFLGFKTGSATTALVGMGVLIFAGFMIYLLAKMLFDLGLGVVKIVLIIALLIAMSIGVIKAYQLLFSKTRALVETTDKTIQSGKQKVIRYFDAVTGQSVETTESSEEKKPKSEGDLAQPAPEAKETPDINGSPDASSGAAPKEKPLEKTPLKEETSLSFTDKMIRGCTRAWQSVTNYVASWFHTPLEDLTAPIVPEKGTLAPSPLPTPVSYTQSGQTQQALAPVTQPNGQKQAEIPQITGVVSEVRSGYLFKMGTHFIKLYGIDAPDPRQSCLDAHGQSFECGRTAKLWLQRLILGKAVTCKLVGTDGRGNFIATCNIAGQDLGAGMVGIGWAVADRQASQVYIPYEQDARARQQGLWAGKFVAPWEARAQARMNETKDKDWF